VHLGDDERHLGVHPPGGGVVDHGDAGLGEPGGLRAGGRPARGEQRDVQTRDVGRGRILDDDLLALERQGPPGRAGGGEEPHLFGGEVALLEQGAQHGADLPGRSDDSDPYTHRPVPPYTTASTSSASSPNAACTARTASSSWWMPTMTESRISEV